MKKALFLLPIFCTLAMAQVTIGGSNFPLINTGPPPNCLVGVSYAVTISATGGVLPYTWTLANSTTLPAGLALNASNGLISGNCTSPGTTNFQIQVTDAVGNFSSNPFTIVVTAPLSINPGAFPNAVDSVSYTSGTVPSAAGGTPGYSWSCCTVGALPGGLSMNSVTGVVTGTTVVSPGTIPFTFKVTDSAGAMATQASSIIVTGSAPSTGPPGYLATSTSTAIIQYPPAPFTGGTGLNQIKCDASINGACSSTAGVDPIMRASDSTTGSLGFTVDISGGSGDNIFASDDSKIALTPQNTGGICVIAFNSTTMQVTNPCTTIPNSHSVSWAHTNANVLYSLTASTPSGAIGGTTCKAPCIVKTTFSSPTAFTQTVVMDPTVACSALIPTGTYSGGSVSNSGDDNIVYGAIVTNQQNSVGYVFAYNISTGHCSALSTNTGQVMFFDNSLHASTIPCFPIGLHNSNIFQNGTWSRITTGTIGACPNQPLTWNVGTATVNTCTALSGHNSNGWNIETQISNPIFHWANVTSGTYCTDIASQTYGSSVTTTFPGDIELHFGINHISAGETEPIVGGTAYVNWPGGNWTVPGVMEVWAFQRSPFKWQRFFHTFSSGATLCPTCDFRDTEVIVTQSQTGKFAAFCSDMLLGLGNNSLGQPRIDVFIGRLD